MFWSKNVTPFLTLKAYSLIVLLCMTWVKFGSTSEHEKKLCPPSGWQLKYGGFSEHLKRRLEMAHSNYKLDHSLCLSPPTFVWDYQLEEMAQQYVRQCPDDNEIDETLVNYKFNNNTIIYQNVFVLKGTRDNFFPNFDDVVNTWANRDKTIFRLKKCDDFITRIGCGVLVRYALPINGFAYSFSQFSGIKNYKKTPFATHIVCNYT